jgi:hypothetical protein
MRGARGPSARAYARANANASFKRSTPPGNPAADRQEKASQSRNAARGGMPKPPAKGGGLDLGQFARDVSTNYAKGVAAVGRGLDESGLAGRSRELSRGIPSAPQSKKNNDALKKALGRK